MKRLSLRIPALKLHAAASNTKNLPHISDKLRCVVTFCLCLVICISTCTLLGCNQSPDETSTDSGTYNTIEPESDSDAYSATDTDTIESPPEESVGIVQPLEATDTDMSKFKNVITYDASTSEYNFTMLIAINKDVTDFTVTKLIWNEDLRVDSEQAVHVIGDLNQGDAVLLTADSVEIIGYTGISYCADGKTYRAFPATSGLDSSPLLVNIGRHMSIDMIYPDVPKFELEISEDIPLGDSFNELYGNRSKDPFVDLDAKALTVKGLSVPLYLRYDDEFKVISASAYGHTLDLSDGWIITYHSDLTLLECNDAVIFTVNKNNSVIKTLVFTEDGAVEFDSDTEDCSTVFHKTEDDSLEYTRISNKFRYPVSGVPIAPLDLATSRDELYREVGTAYVENGKLLFSQPTLCESIDDAFDLDSLLEEYPIIFNGYGSVDEILADNAEGKTKERLLVMPDESYEGAWTYSTDSISIKEVTENEIKFSSGIFRTFGFDATATLTDGVWTYVEDSISKDDNDKVRGRLEFTHDSVTLIYDTYGNWGEVYPYLYAWGTSYTFTNHVSGTPLSISDRLQVCTGRYNTSRMLGHYTVNFGEAADDIRSHFSIIVTVKACNGGCDGGESQGSFYQVAEYGIEDGWQYPVKVYGILINEEYESLKETDPSQYSKLMLNTKYIFDMGNGMHYSIFINAYSGISPQYEFDQNKFDEAVKSAVLTYTLIDQSAD